MKYLTQILWLGMLCATLSSVGCGTQQFQPTARELLKPLQTAVSAKKLEWIEATEKKIAAEDEDGNLTSWELDALSNVIELARANQWKDAQQALTKLIDGQRATSEDLAQLREGRSNSAADEHRRQAKRSKI